MAQLHMLWPKSWLDMQPEVTVPEGYALRTYADADAEAHVALMHKAGFADWTPEKLTNSLMKVLPEGLFLAEHLADRRLVAAAMAWHNPSALHRFGGELGWVAGDPEHKGKGLGQAVCAAVVCRFLSAGYGRIYLQTDDWRLAAIKTYLKLGFVPYLYRPEAAEIAMEERWKKVCETLHWRFDPDTWREET